VAEGGVAKVADSGLARDLQVKEQALAGGGGRSSQGKMIVSFWAVLQIRIRIQIRIRWIHMFLGLLDTDPDPLVRGMDPDPDPSIIKQK
jgi:hypothetical protein